MESGRDFVVPFRYGIVNHGVYRGAYPTLPNFRFLHQLKLKTIVSLVPEKPSPDLQRFAELLGIDLVHVRLERGASLNANLHIQLMKAVNICIDPDNFPVYIHCLDGRRLTSLVVLILRKLQLYSVQWSFSEYWRYQCHGRTPFPIQDIERASKDIEKYMSSLDTSELVIPLKGIPSWLAGGNRARFAAIYSKSIGGGGGSSSSLKTIHNSGNLGSGKVSQVVLASTSSSDFLPANILAAQSLLSFPNNEAAVNTSSTPRILTSDSKVITGLALHGMDLPIRATRKKSSGHIKIPKPL